MTNFGKLNQEKMRKYWPHEAHDFTRWLAQDENLMALAMATGLGKLELVEREARVGPYSADLLAKTSADEYVIIENQYGKTDHDHLGKALTYASVLNGEKIIWIAEEFTEEHKRAVGWLNDLTPEYFEFYAVSLEVWTIDDSRPAFTFKVLVRPAGVKTRTVVGQATHSEYSLKQEKFWQLFRQRLIENKIAVKPRNGKGKNIFRVITSDGILTLRCCIDIKGHTGAIYVRLSKNNAKSDFEQLFLQREAIEMELGEALTWNQNAEFNRMIMLSRECDFTSDVGFEEYADWLTDKAGKFIRVFKGRLTEIASNPGRAIEESNNQDEDDE